MSERLPRGSVRGDGKARRDEIYTRSFIKAGDLAPSYPKEKKKKKNRPHLTFKLSPNFAARCPPTPFSGSMTRADEGSFPLEPSSHLQRVLTGLKPDNAAQKLSKSYHTVIGKSPRKVFGKGRKFEIKLVRWLNVGWGIRRQKREESCWQQCSKFLCKVCEEVSAEKKPPSAKPSVPTVGRNWS